MSPGLDSRSFDPFDQGFVQDPYPVYALLRERDPVHRSAHGFWVLSRYDDVAAAFLDPRLSNAPGPYARVHARHRGRHVSADIANNIIPFLDAPELALARGRADPLGPADGTPLAGVTADRRRADRIGAPRRLTRVGAPATQCTPG